MIYKLLGLVSFLVGIVFALLTVLVFLPFLSNFNGSLLILVVLFGIFAFVFLGVGWQLLHPPKPAEEEQAVTDPFGGRNPAAESLGTPPAVEAAAKASGRPEPAAEWSLPSDGEGGAFANLPGGHTDLEGENGHPETGVDHEDPYFLHRHGTFRKSASPAPGDPPVDSSS